MTYDAGSDFMGIRNDGRVIWHDNSVHTTYIVSPDIKEIKDGLVETLMKIALGTVGTNPGTLSKKERKKEDRLVLKGRKG